MDHVNSTMMVNALESGIAAIGYDKLGIKKENLGHNQLDSV